MKLLISVDIEGIAGVYHPQQVRAGNPEYERARRLMAEEANAAIAGAFEGGATEIWVNDSHGDFRNLPPELINPRAQLIQGKPRRLGMVAGVELGVDGLYMIGYHSRVQAAGILAHTINSFAFAGIAINGQLMGEAGLYGGLAAEYGVSVLLASGDDAFIAETRPLFPRALWIQTKQAGGHTSGTSLSPTEACRMIHTGAAQAVRDWLNKPPSSRPTPARWPTPLQVKLYAQNPALADLFALWPGFERLAPCELGFEANSMENAVRILNCCSAMSAQLR